METTETLSREATIVYAILTIVALIPGVIYLGFVFSYLWLWFIVPLGVPAISVAHAVGLGLLKGFMFYRMQRKEESKDAKKNFATTFAYFFIVPTISLGLGYVVANWFM